MVKCELSHPYVKLSFPFDELDKNREPLRLSMGRVLGARWRSPSWFLRPTADSKHVIESLVSDIEWGPGALELINAADAPILRELFPVSRADFKLQPYDHQIAALNHCYGQESWALFMEMGTGKTKVGIDLAFQYYKEKRIRALVVMCPKTIREDAWGHGFRVNGWPSAEVEGYIPDGYSKKKAEIVAGVIQGLQEIKELPLQVIVLNYDSLLSTSVRQQLGILCEIAPTMCICDESTAIKNHMAKRSKALVALRDKFAFRGIMTGSPVTESPIDIFGQYLFIDPSEFGQSFAAFRSRFCVMGGFEGKQVVGYQNLEELRRRIYRRAFRVTKAECLTLPEKIGGINCPTGPLVRHFDMSDGQAKWHQDMAREMVIECEGEDDFTAAIVLTKFRRLQEITSGYIREGERIKHLAVNPKGDALLELLEESGDKKVVVWCQEREEIRMVVELLKKRELDLQKEAPREYIQGVVCEIHGDVKDRQHQIDAFKQAPGRAYMVMNPQSGGMGLTLNEATLVIFYTNGFSAKDREQAEDRCHRIGQTNHVTYYDLIARNSVDEYVMKTLLKKQDISATLVDMKAALQNFASKKGLSNGSL